MQLYPAIELKDGKCVRQTQGRMSELKVYSDEPWEVARHWEEQGATFLHLVDLDGALKGHSVNETVIRQIAETVQIPIQLGGGIRSMEAVETALELGVSRVIIGTKAVTKPEFMGRMVEAFGPEYIVAGVDVQDGMALVEGRERNSGVGAEKLCLLMKSYGIRHLVCTDVLRDGMLTGPNVALARELTAQTQMDIIAAGGIASMEDLRRLYQVGVQGAIIGKALYEKRLNLREAVGRFEEEIET